MTCEHVQKKLTGYLDGELDAADGSAVRGHLRECADCRRVASEEAALRDGLRQLPPVDPPARLWHAVQAQLAAAEVADAKRPAWRRALARWMPVAPRFAAGALVGAAAVFAVWWRAHRSPSDDAAPPPPPVHDVAIAPPPAPPPTPAPAVGPETAPADDVTADLARDADRRSAQYSDAAGELLALAQESRPQWTDQQKNAFDARVGELRAKIGRATDGRPRQAAWRELIRYLQGAVIRDEVTLAGGGR